MPSAAKTPTKQRLIDAAEELFAERGYESISVVEIAERVGIRGPTFYKHFKNKLVIYEAVLEQLFEPYAALVEAQAGDPKQAWLKAMVVQHASNPNIPRIVQHATQLGGEQLELLLDKWYRPIFSNWTDHIDQASDPEQLRFIMMACHSLTMGYMSLAPFHAKLLGTDPLSPDNLDRLLDWLKIKI